MKTLHEVGIKVLGDAVLNHRCAHFKNQSGIWNLFGGRLNWDDRAIVADDPHFQVDMGFLYVLCSLLFTLHSVLVIILKELNIYI